MKVVSRVIASPSETDALLHRLLEIAAATLQEPGCVSYEVFEDVQDPTDFTVIAEYADAAAYEEHFSHPYMQAFLADLPSMTTGALESRALKEVMA